MLAARELESVEVYLWPDCVELWDHWCALQTQWQYSAGGSAIGLAYAGVRAYLELCADLRGPELSEAFACIQAAERGHLDGLAERARLEDEQR